MIVIVADDMGRHDLTSAGSKIQTPNLDSLSENGVKEGIKSLVTLLSKTFSPPASYKRFQIDASSVALSANRIDA